MEIGFEIGRGGYGSVYEIKNDPSICAKVSDKKMNSCRKWSNEFHKINTFMSKISEEPKYKSLKMVRIIKPVEFKETDGKCMMIMPRIYRPDDVRRFSLTHRKDTYKPSHTIQAQLGIPSGKMVFKSRGEFIGLKEIRSYVTEPELKIACYELGMTMALIHTMGKNDAYDIEVYLGREHLSRKTRFYIADFDLSEEIHNYNEETMERMAWSLEAMPYFPTMESDPALFQLFKKGYATVANNPALTERIFKNYT